MKLVVVGGVAAGASAAARARRIDENADIVMFERGQHVSFANCGLPYHIGGAISERQRLLLQTPESLQAALALDVRVGTEVTSIDRENKQVEALELGTGRRYHERYDKLILCPGAVPIRPPLPGIDHPNVFVLRNVVDMDAIKAAVDANAEAAVVIGGGYIGVEMAESLRERGLAVDLVEMVDQIMPPLDPEMARDLEDHMRQHGVRLHLGVAAAALRDADGRVRVELADGKVLGADLVVLAAGVKPDTALAEAAGLELGPRGGIRVDSHLRTSDPDIYAAGDAVEVKETVSGAEALIPLAGPANRQGRTAGENACGRDREYHSTQGTAIVKVFDMTGGGTGASEKQLLRTGMPYHKVYLHPAGHAGYYPDTAPMHLKLLFAPQTGAILGAQVVGYDGVDKRLDVLATALRAGLTVFDLEDLELAYAPPYGSAKDPVNMAGFVAANLLKGDAVFWYPEDCPEQTRNSTVIDVRGTAEFELGHIPGAINIPLPKLRSSLDGIPRDRPVMVYCKVGFRSYLAYRLLVQRGYDVKTLSGGMLTFRNCHGEGVCGGHRPEPQLPYAEEKTAAAPPPSGRTIEVDCCGLQCPGPIRKLSEAMSAAETGDEILAKASDPGFARDVPAWCRRHGHEVVALDSDGPHTTTTVRIRKGAPVPCLAARSAGAAGQPDKKTMVVFSGDLDKVLAAFVIANGAVAMGSEVTMFFTFWGLNALRRTHPPAVDKPLLDRMFGWMMPRGAGRLKLSKMNMAGMGTVMMKHVMATKGVDDLPSLMDAARRAGVKLVACSMSMDVMGLAREELIDGLEIGGVASFLGESDDAGMTLFI